MDRIEPQKKVKSVLITGASSGIGRAAALEMDKKGWRVFGGVRKTKDGQSLQSESSGRIIPVIIDVLDMESIKAAVREVEGMLDGAGLDGLVNNAGISISGPLEFVPIEKVKEQMAINYTGNVAVTQAFLPLLRKAKGRLVFMGSESGRITLPMVGPYSASKFAIEAAANAFRIELFSFGIRVSIIEPGMVKTPLWDKLGAYTDDFIRSMPEEARVLYKTELNAMMIQGKLSGKMAFSVDKVSRAVFHALTAPRPKPRYLVGAEAWILVAFYGITPTPIADWITRKIVTILGKFKNDPGL